jgi:hypothetical protein
MFKDRSIKIERSSKKEQLEGGKVPKVTLKEERGYK